MARGFSHSGRGGGSSGGGGFSFGGTSRSGGSSGGGFSFNFGGSSHHRHNDSYHGGHHYHHRPRRPWHVPMFGRTVIITPGVRSALSFVIMFFVIALFFSITSFTSVSSYKTKINESKEYIARYEEYDELYSGIIEKALDDEDGYFLTIATFDNKRYITYGDNPTDLGYYETDVYMNAQHWYFIVYAMEYDEDDSIGQAKGGKWIDSTFVQFDQYVYQDKSGVIEVAYTYINGQVYAINTDYSLEDNMEYAYELQYLESLKATRSNSLGTALISGGVALLIFSGMVLYFVKKYKKAQKKEELELEKAQAETAAAQATATLAAEKAKQINRVCAYCGASVPDGDDNCPACGSRMFEDK